MGTELVEGMIAAVSDGHTTDSVIDEAKKKQAKKGGSAPRLMAYSRGKKRKMKVTPGLSSEPPAKQAAALTKSSKTLKQAMDKLNFFTNRLGAHMSSATWAKVKKVFNLLPKQGKFKKKK